MARTTFRSFTKNLDVTDLRWMPGEGFSPSRLRIELLSGLTVALALVPEAVAFAFVATIGHGPDAMQIDIIDIFECDASGKVAAMRAYWGPENMRAHSA